MPVNPIKGGAAASRGSVKGPQGVMQASNEPYRGFYCFLHGGCRCDFDTEIPLYPTDYKSMHTYQYMRIVSILGIVNIVLGRYPSFGYLDHSGKDIHEGSYRTSYTQSIQNVGFAEHGVEASTESFFPDAAFPAPL